MADEVVQSTEPIVADQNTETIENTVDDIASELSGNEEQAPDIQEPREEQQEQKEESQEFNAEDLDFEQDDANNPIYKNIEGYDLEAYKDILNFEDEEAVGFIKEELTKLKQAGFTQEQADLYIKSHLKTYQEEQEEEERLHSKEYVKEKLKTKLSKEEQRNYRPILNMMKEISNTGVFPKEWINDAMSNPNLVKILNGIYKHQTNTNTVKEIPQPKQKATMTPSMAFEKYKDWIISQKNVTLDKTNAFVESLRPYIMDKDMNDFNEIFKGIMIK